MKLTKAQLKEALSVYASGRDTTNGSLSRKLSVLGWDAVPIVAKLRSLGLIEPCAYEDGPFKGDIKPFENRITKFGSLVLEGKLPVPANRFTLEKFPSGRGFYILDHATDLMADHVTKKIAETVAKRLNLESGREAFLSVIWRTRPTPTDGGKTLNHAELSALLKEKGL